MSRTESGPQPPAGLACGEVRGGNGIAHDSADVVPGPPGPALWHVVKNRLLS